MNQIMKAVRFTQNGNELQLSQTTQKIPSLGKNEVLIKVKAASLNFRDHAALSGNYPGGVEMVVPLSDGAGEVVAVGEKVTRVNVGSRVSANCWANWVDGAVLKPEYYVASIGFNMDGWLAEYIVLHEMALVQLPDYLSYAEAATLPCSAVTAWNSIHQHSTLTAGQTVLVQGAGGVSVFALQLAKLSGARVLAIASRDDDDKAELLKDLGAETVVNYGKNPDWEKEILKLTNGLGVDKVVEVAGEKTINKSVSSTKAGGNVAVVGFASGMGGGVSPLEIMTRGIQMGATTMGSRSDFEAMLVAMASAEMKPVIDSVFEFDDYQKAYDRLQSGNVMGKVVIEF
ncbi:NAD(P)-dependent alcohol dehydrogenase [Serratia sp. S1B]|nr:NAD(P)-dependent alcohol dehydrogenase [Serratia sp. S1B]